MDPMDPELWRMDRYRDFLEARKNFTRRRSQQTVRRSFTWGYPLVGHCRTFTRDRNPCRGWCATSEADEQELETLNAWVERQGLPRGQITFDYADAETGAQKAIFDLAWPNGLQPGLTAPVAVLLKRGC